MCIQMPPLSAIRVRTWQCLNRWGTNQTHGILKFAVASAAKAELVTRSTIFELQRRKNTTSYTSRTWSSPTTQGFHSFWLTLTLFYLSLFVLKLLIYTLLSHIIEKMINLDIFNLTCGLLGVTSPTCFGLLLLFTYAVVPTYLSDMAQNDYLCPVAP